MGNTRQICVFASVPQNVEKVNEAVMSQNMHIYFDCVRFPESRADCGGSRERHNVAKARFSMVGSSHGFDHVTRLASTCYSKVLLDNQNTLRDPLISHQKASDK